MSSIAGVGGASFFSPQADRARPNENAGLQDGAGGVSGAQTSDQNDVLSISELKQSGPAPGVVSGESLVTSQVNDSAFRQAIVGGDVAERTAAATPAPDGARADENAKVVVIADPENGLPVVVKFENAADIDPPAPPRNPAQPLDKTV